MATAVGGLSSLASYTSEDDEGDDTNEAAAIRVDTSNAQNGLMGHGGARSISTLGTWLKEHRIQVSDDVEVVDTSDAGWTLRALSDLAEHHVLCRIPKTAILSLRTTSLVLPSCTPGYEPRSTHSVWFLALALLHEIRLGPASRFYGYVQSLPRETIPLPMFWGVHELCESDGKLALDMLKGTDAARDLEKQRLEGKSLDDLEQFYDLYSNLLPPTKLHPRSSPFPDYLYTYSLVSTRAFVIDVYHTLALCPFADILNHSHAAHTSLSSDDFVCHICGSLRVCAHDRPTTSGIPLRLADLSAETIRKLQTEEDTVDLTVEVEEIKAGQEIFNSYGANLSSSQLLREWGYLDRGNRAYITFDLAELAVGEEVHGFCAASLESLVSANGPLPQSRYLAPLSTDDPHLVGVHRATGRINPGMWCRIYVATALPDSAGVGVSEYIEAFDQSLSLDHVLNLPSGFLTSTDRETMPTVRLAAQKVASVLETRLIGIRPGHSSIGPLSQMACEYAMAERQELQRVLDLWRILA